MSLSILATASFVVISRAAKPRVWQPQEVPIAFWSWRLVTPATKDVKAAAQATNLQVLFLHAGQIDLQDKKLNRIRPVEGEIPRGVPLHLVYNSTRAFLQEIERLNPGDVSAAVISAFDQDRERARGDQADVAGVQLDFDVPTRLLRNYAAILRKIREQLPGGVQLSITGLPTWVGSSGLREPLSVCDFWIPQCYGASIAGDVHQQIPISTADVVERAVEMSRRLGVPFYAGLAAYGYAIHYSQDGTLIGLRGDLDSQAVVANDRFELVSETPCFINGNRNSKVGEWLYRYRAIRDVMVDGTAIRKDQSLLLDCPTSAGLRECGRRAREQGDGKLLGICIFRIPTDGDSTNLTLPEIVAAINDADPSYSIEARATQSTTNQPNGKTILKLELSNSGSTTSKVGDEALTLIVPLAPGSLSSIAVDDQALANPVFTSDGTAMPCSPKRASAVQVTTPIWRPGSQVRIAVELDEPLIREVKVTYSSALDDGTTVSGSTNVIVTREAQ